jgi:hypothetical protein
MNSFFLWVWILLMIMVILFFSIKQENIEEGFTPKIRSLYRPHIRNLRIYSETFTNKYSTNYLISILKKMGLY